MRRRKHNGRSYSHRRRSQIMKFDIAEFGFCKDKNEINLDNVLPINRRKMSNAAKFIYTSISGFGNLDCPIVFATNFGEIDRCIGLLSELSLSGLVSPTSFSLSVLNASVASVAIQKQIHAPIFAISSSAPVEMAMISAASKLNQFDKICVISYEESVHDKMQICAAFILKNGVSSELSIAKMPSLGNSLNSTENFIKNIGKDFYFFDDEICYKWKFNADF
ncbi:hypothetical protein CDQ80_00735 [Campylobacter hyointestinalis subsp. hyointestinalis]|nr:hypothetical protein CDQ79_04240 [Campylobacter hyointestinalis subsp. hyointestinalis]PPB75737.1 hypothetical protein CDQ80_00735 [Campylobacter hyointestinalis subsp. hyointestinalis]PPB78121.1 hypothetical protein CDQ81_01060 [Campylobacter hyointestinalis subsp. hyointestinalis]PPB78972.1 hypothetical protein CDQ82_02345 [Campylobacter hyointestinalis subsp. hyointestinalis]